MALQRVHDGVRTLITHDMLIDYIMANPDTTYPKIAKEFGYSASGISVIMHSDSFKARYQVRKQEVMDPVIMAELEARMKGLAAQSMDILARKLETSDDAGFALKVFDSTTRAAGYGVQKPVAVNTQFVVHLPGPAASSNEWSSRFAPKDAPVLKARVEDAPSEAGQRPEGSHVALPLEQANAG